MEWMRAAYDGALATQEHLRESRMDTSQPHQTIQSTKEIDDEVQSDLERQLKMNFQNIYLNKKKLESQDPLL